MQHSNQPLPWQAWSYEVQQRLQKQQEQIDMLHTQVADLCIQLKQLEAKPTYNIESLEYHFDQLKVEKLDGTLNIGMAAPGSNQDAFPGSIEQLAVDKKRQFPSANPAITPPNESYTAIHARMNSYLDSEAAQKLLAYEKDLCLSLDPQHRRIIIEDIRKQVPTRIHYYLHELQNGKNEDIASYPDLIIDHVFAKTKRDADTALHSYMRQLHSEQSAKEG